MNNETTDTSTRPYSTIEEKIKLFQENGIVAKQYKDEDDDYDWAKAGVMVFCGDNKVAQQVEDIANQNGIAISLMSCEWYYGGKPLPEPPGWFVIFADTFSNFCC